MGGTWDIYMNPTREKRDPGGGEEGGGTASALGGGDMGTITAGTWGHGGGQGVMGGDMGSQGGHGAQLTRQTLRHDGKPDPGADLGGQRG